MMAVATTALSWSPLAALALMVVAWLKIRPQLKQISSQSETEKTRLSNEREAGLVASLSARVSTLENEIVLLRQGMDRERAAHEAEMRVVRHRLHNETTSLDGLLDLLQVNPDRVIESVAAIKERRARNKQAIAAEQGAMAGAQMKDGA